MANLRFGSGNCWSGRLVIQLPHITIGHIFNERTQVDMDPYFGKVLGLNVAKFRSYLWLIAQWHVSIVIPSWDEVEET